MTLDPFFDDVRNKCPEFESYVHVHVSVTARFVTKNPPDLRHGNPIVHRASYKDRESAPCSEPQANAYAPV